MRTFDEDRHRSRLFYYRFESSDLRTVQALADAAEICINLRCPHLGGKDHSGLWSPLNAAVFNQTFVPCATKSEEEVQSLPQVDLAFICAGFDELDDINMAKPNHYVPLMPQVHTFKYYVI